MRQITIAFLLLASLAALTTAAVALRRQQQLNEKLSRMEETVSHLREVAAAAARAERDAMRGPWMMLRAQESPWQRVADAPIEARLTASFDEAPVSEPVHLLAEIRNAGDRDQTVSGLLLHPVTIRLYHNGRAARYLGPAITIAPGRLPTLPPGRIARASLVITPQDFAELGQPGEFVVEWSYVSGLRQSRIDLDR